MATAPSGSEVPDGDDEPRRQLSMPRVFLALVILVGVLGGSAWTIRRSLTASASSPPSSTWFAPYVDTTLTPITQFQDPGSNVARQVALGFVVSDPQQACSPSWGGYYNLDQASTSLNLDRRIAQVRSQGGDVIVSFGGASNSELALGCTDPASLQAAYASVISRYQLTTVDFDIEGAAVSDVAAAQRRGSALAALQKSQKASGHRLSVWLTLPVAPSGLQDNAQAIISATLAAGVQLSGVNLMTMDFGVPESDMGATVRSALDASHDQLEAIYARYGMGATSSDVWNRMGATVMIGQNDTAGEIFTIADAQSIYDYAKSRHLARVSMWSLNRDSQCGSSFAEIGVHSNTCSGTAQTDLEFSKIFAGFTGSPSENLVAQSSLVTSTTIPVDNPATSPYPIWQATRAYVTGYKVVRLGAVYQAKWYTQGVDPAATASAGASPWQLIGPVLPGDNAPTTTTLPPGTHPTWSPTPDYLAGDKVLYQGLPYQAKWYNQATSPGAENADPADSPWQPLFTVPGEPAGS